MNRNLTCVILLAAAAAPLSAQEGWTRFRGPNGAGVSQAVLPTHWSESDYRWTTELPGDGHSSPVLFGEHIYITCAEAQTARQWLLAVREKDGSFVWKVPLESRPYPQHRFNSFASATPAVDARHVYVPIASSEEHALVAVTHEGQEAWRYEVGPFQSQHGCGASPIVYQDTVIVPNDQDGASFIVALNTADGKVRWKTDRKSGPAAYATPCLYTGPDGKDQLILVSTASGMSGFDPVTGKVLWEIGDLFSLRVCASPVVAGDLIIATCGQGGGGKRLVAVRPGSFDGSRKPQLAYEVTQALPYVPTPLYRNGLLFLLNDGGVATCIEAATGAVKWRERLGGDFFASPVCADGVIYCVSRAGEVVTLRAGEQFHTLGRVRLPEPSHATPALGERSLYLRTERMLMKISAD